MRSRKVHPKTRNGCLGCKQRHVKCGEEKPICANCVKRSVPCSFQAITPSGDVKALLLSSASKPVVQPAIPESTSTATSSATSPKEYPPTPRTASPQSTTSLSNDATPSYLSISPGSGSGTSYSLPSPQMALDSLTPYMTSIDSSIPFGVRDRELFHFFINHTAISLCSYVEVTRPMWQNEIPRLALNNSLVRNTLLAIASMDRARRNRSSTDYTTLVTKAASRLNMALPDFRVAIENVNADNCTDLFTCSVFIALYTFADSTVEYRSLASSAFEQVGTYATSYRVQLLSGMLRGLRGTFLIFNRANSWLMQGPLESIVMPNAWPDGIVLSSAFAANDDQRLSQLEQLWTEPGSEDPETSQILSEALLLLRYTFSLVTHLHLTQSSHGGINTNLSDSSYTTPSGWGEWRSPYDHPPDAGAISQFPIKISFQFLRLMDSHNPFALILAAHFAVILHRARGYYWWLEGISELFVITAKEVVYNSGVDMRWIDWPVEVVLANKLETWPQDDEKKRGEVLGDEGELMDMS